MSNLGKIRNSKGKVLKTYTNNSGYACVKLASKRRRHCLVHRLVAEAFVVNPDPNKYNVVNHLDANRLNNVSSNLEWCSTKQNLAHARALGRMVYNKPTLGRKLKGQRVGSSSYYGVFRNDYKYKDTIKEKWVAYLRVNGKTLETKSFDTELEAAKYYDYLLDKYQVTTKPKNF
ncbi:HNH endonuclease [Neisseria sp. N95_16]|uniref:AP2/ERF domain-containing protein n=1 Tax=Neisseria brasiliensis TaxID=2666100 RepID=A0A7X2KYV9_9NEIS|nr:hypothetical protein [Neisseria brasiliensis]PJO10514.1 HNH endonuclease [Neisseria sp. N95_16]